MKQILFVLGLFSAIYEFANAAGPIISSQQASSLGIPSGSSFGTPGNASFDYVIVGGGTAGLVLAARLSENPSTSVAVIEAGSFYELNGNYSEIPALDTLWAGKDPKDTNPEVDWGFDTVPQAGALNAIIHYARGKCLGGSSARNYLGYLRSTKDAYTRWAQQVGDQSYTFDNLLPYYEKSLDFTPPDYSKRVANATPQFDVSNLGKGGPLSVTFSNYAQAIASYVQKGLQELGIHPINGLTSGELLGSSYVMDTIQPKNQQRESSETGFLRPALGRTNLKVYPMTLAKKILFDSKKAAIGVGVDTENEDYVLSANKEVVVSAGAFQSPQLLMVSGIGPAATLKKYNIPIVAERPGVGQNMQDHILMGPSYRVNVITGTSLINATFAAEAASLFDNFQSGILTNPGGDFGAWEKLPQSLRSTLPESAQTALATFPADWPEIEYLSIAGYLGNQEDFTQPDDGYDYSSVAIALTAPLSRGTIDISSVDMSDPPLIDPRWLTDPTDIAVAVAGYKRVRELFATEAMKKVEIGIEYYPGLNVSTDAEILQIIRESVSTVYHASATCAMGNSTDPKAVIDPSAKVIGVKNLRVVDASSFPFLPPGHPQSTVYALAEKIAHEILAGK
ncbi:MAG: hypothetical protein ALECFALPRED_007237 [Alectoria fallacina]|uniref:Glucose-methanol-choline oxidoreductase N-terminal domain-containing protein n=1 Tax=Alectoria fallacina TaxID=1903189 RepID=A0A8H3IX62_9LECA|nr:MAG: hypothetical protein ALECFALPRED_007237 [Alectoria fallacina]